MDQIKYPTGKFNPTKITGAEQIAALITQLEQHPSLAKQAVTGLTEAQIDTPYRPGGWSVRQVIHHIADAHLNAYIRHKLALTADNPTINVWEEETWGIMEDARKAPVDLSLAILSGVCARWVISLRAMSPEDFNKVFIHPQLGEQTLADNLQKNAWHGSHHISQVQSLRKRLDW